MESLTKYQVLGPLSALISKLIALIFGHPATAPEQPAAVIVEAPAVVTPAPCVNAAGLSGDELDAVLDALFPANDDAKIPTILDTAEDGESPAAPSFGGDTAHGCAVAYPSPLHPHRLIRPLSLAERYKVAVTPLDHLFGKPDGAFKLPTYTPAVSWSRSTSQQKFEQGIRSAQSRRGVAISCNLSKDREQALLKAENPAELLSTYISRWSRAKLGVVLPYAFQFEFSPTGRLHIHGVVLLDRATQQELDALKEALAMACGKIKHHEGSRQLKLVELYDADGWTGYFGKTVSRTKRLLGKSAVIYMSDGLRAHARADWSAAHIKGTPERRAA